MVAQTPDEAISNAKRYTRCVPGHCLEYTRTWLGIGSRDYDADEAWFNTPSEHRHTTPARHGSPVFWAGGDHGHVDLRMYRYQRSTDVPSAGIVSSVPATWIPDNWGYSRRGWTSMLNGVVIPYLVDDYRTKGDVYVSKLHLGARNSESVARLRYRLNDTDLPERVKPPVRDVADPDGADYDMSVATAVRHWQRSLPKDFGGPTDGKSLNNRQANRLFGPDYRVIEA